MRRAREPGNLGGHGAVGGRGRVSRGVRGDRRAVLILHGVVDPRPGRPIRASVAAYLPHPDYLGSYKRAALEEISKHDHVLTPGRHVGAAAQEDDSALGYGGMSRAADWRGWSSDDSAARPS